MAEYQYGGKNTQTFQKLHGFKKIVAWQAASDLNSLVNQLVGRFGPGYHKLADQMRSAAIAVSGNIAEGYCSGYLANYIEFLCPVTGESHVDCHHPDPRVRSRPRLADRCAVS